MVKITNGKEFFEVTRGAFDGIYSRQGYTIINEKKAKQDNGKSKENKLSEDDKFLNEIIEKPISQWSKDEVKRVATLKGIDISGTKNATEAKEIIKKFLNEEI